MTCCGDDSITTAPGGGPPPPPPIGSDGCLRIRYVCECVLGTDTWSLHAGFPDCVSNDLCTGQIACTDKDATIELFNQCIIGAPVPVVPDPAQAGDLVLNIALCAPSCCPVPDTPPTTTTPPPTTTTTPPPTTPPPTTPPPSEPCACAGPQPDAVVSGAPPVYPSFNGTYTYLGFSYLSPTRCRWRWVNSSSPFVVLTLIYDAPTLDWRVYFDMADGYIEDGSSIVCAGVLSGVFTLHYGAFPTDTVSVRFNS